MDFWLLFFLVDGSTRGTARSESTITLLVLLILALANALAQTTALAHIVIDFFMLALLHSRRRFIHTPQNAQATAEVRALGKRGPQQTCRQTQDSTHIRFRLCVE